MRTGEASLHVLQADHTFEGVGETVTYTQVKGERLLASSAEQSLNHMYMHCLF